MNHGKIMRNRFTAFGLAVLGHISDGDVDLQGKFGNIENASSLPSLEGRGAERWVETFPVSCLIMFRLRHGLSRPPSPSPSLSAPLTIMELEALIKHLLSELRNRETVILDNIDSLKVNIVFYSSHHRV